MILVFIAACQTVKSPVILQRSHKDVCCAAVFLHCIACLQNSPYRRPFSLHVSDQITLMKDRQYKAFPFSFSLCHIRLLSARMHYTETLRFLLVILALIIQANFRERWLFFKAIAVKPCAPDLSVFTSHLSFSGVGWCLFSVVCWVACHRGIAEGRDVKLKMGSIQK